MLIKEVLSEIWGCMLQMCLLDQVCAAGLLTFFTEIKPYNVNVKILNSKTVRKIYYVISNQFVVITLS